MELIEGRYKAAVIGAGPAGVACVGNLLEKIASTDILLWVDPRFEAGRLSTYHRVPSNTKVALFCKFARACPSFKPDESPTLAEVETKIEPQSTCQLEHAASLCTEITDNLKSNPQVVSMCNVVDELIYSDDDQAWTLRLSDGQQFIAEKVILATGSHPRSLNTTPSNCQEIHLDVALNPELLAKQVRETDTVAVYGNSHSAMLVLMNLLHNTAVKHIVNVYRQPMKFAEYPDPVNRPEQILHDNTGLKGEVATWVRGWHLEEGPLFDGRLTRVNTTTQPEAVVDCAKVIYAVGYKRNTLPVISGLPGFSWETLDYTKNGQLTTQGALIKGLFGYGIAFPERVVDLDGTPELAVGLWKFMKHIKKSFDTIRF